MSTRHLLNMTTGAIAILLLAAVGMVFSTSGNQEAGNTGIEVAKHQQVLVQDLYRQVDDLSQAEDLAAVNQARNRMAGTILRFDQALGALLGGGVIENEPGRKTTVVQTKNPAARKALEAAAEVWLETGMPLADLAAGEFSVFSAAGQQAVKSLRANQMELAQHMGTAAAAFRQGIESQHALARLARYASAGLAFLLVGLLGLRLRRAGRPAAAATAAPGQAPAPEPALPNPPGRTLAPAAANRIPVADTPVFTSPVDFDNINASVDQLSVDMNTIAGSTDKMRLAIDSVGHALQGMLYSLNEMAVDTAEGCKVVRGANNAASYTASAAATLADSAREMSAVVARVTQLALKTKQVAAQIDAEAIHTGQTGDAFTSVVATEVKGLAAQTSHATNEVENTVADILATSRQYEEAIGQIIKNIANINRVCQNLGEMMLNPPPAPVAGAPLAPALAPAVTPAATPPAAPEPTAAEAGPQPTDPVPASEPEARTDTEIPAETSAQPEPEIDAEPAAAEAREPAETPQPAAAPEDPWGGIADDPVEPEPTVEEVAEETSSVIEETVESEPEPETDSDPSGSNGNVFMLGGNKPKKAMRLKIPQVETTPEPEAEAPAASEPAPEPAQNEADTPAPEAPASVPQKNIFMLNKPKQAESEPAAEEPPVETANVEPQSEPEEAAKPAAEPAAPEESTEEEGTSGSSGNIFMLNKPK